MTSETVDPAQAFMAKISDRYKSLHDITARGTSNVQQFYSGATVFLTGGSGHIGKQLIEKLLRATNVSKVYILLRCKKGKSIQQRLADIIKDSLYDTVREHLPNFPDKIVAVSGDTSELKLGMSDKDWLTLTDQVDIIFHLAATTRFDETLKAATFINIRGTREILELGKSCKKLRSFVHVSTVYTHACPDRMYGEILEKFYPSPISPITMIGIAETMDEKRINDIISSLIKKWPNTYTFTKAVSEELVNTMGKDLPICVVRPAIVACTIQEPSPGWLDSSCMYGASGVIFAAGLGVLHTLYINDQTKMEVVPVDYVNNTILAAAWETARTKRSILEENEIKIYTVAPSTRNPTSWSTLSDTMCGELRNKYATPMAICYCFAWFTNNLVLFWIYSWVLHIIPAYIADAVASCFGYTRRFAKLAQKLKKMSIALSYFVRGQWNFVDQNTLALYDSLSKDDQQIFNFDVANINWLEYVIIWCLGLRKHFCKDGLKDTLYGCRKQAILRIVAFIVLPLYIYCLLMVAYFSITWVYYFMTFVLSPFK